MTATTKPRKNRAPLNLAMGLVGFVCLIGTAIAASLDADKGVVYVLALGFLIALAIMFATRKSDEYTLALWSTGANAAFAVMVAFLFLGPVVEGFFDGVFEGLFEEPTEQDLTPAAASVIGVFAFFITFNFKRLTGSL